MVAQKSHEGAREPVRAASLESATGSRRPNTGAPPFSEIHARRVKTLCLFFLAKGVLFSLRENREEYTISLHEFAGLNDILREKGDSIRSREESSNKSGELCDSLSKTSQSALFSVFFSVFRCFFLRCYENVEHEIS